jgi:glycosyltransferase involved in cell wall biosynthesis
MHGIRYHGLTDIDWERWILRGKVAVVHGVDPLLASMSKSKVALQLGLRMETFDTVVMVGTPLRDFADAIGLPKSKLSVVPNGTDPVEVLPQVSAVSNDQLKRILSVSNLIDVKGIDYTLRGLALLRDRGYADWVYQVVGDGPELPRLRALTHTLGIQESVTFFGRLGREETLAMMGAADIFCLPSWGEAFGIVYLEAMARAKPVIGCLGAGAADIVSHGQDGFLVPQRNATAVAGILTLLWENADCLASVGAEARVTSRRFTWDVNVERMLSEMQLTPAFQST